MNTHTHFEELLPLYAAGQLGGSERSSVEAHLTTCPDCQTDLELWSALSAEIGSSNRALTAPPALLEGTFERLHAPGRLSLAFRRTWQLLHAQVFLVQREMWPASAVIMFMGVVVALLSKHVEAIYFIAPLVAAASLSVLSGPEYDPAYELALATPTSPWKVLLARLSVVSAYNLLLALVAAMALLFIAPPALFGTLILGWLGPMACLSALALFFSLWIGTGNAIAITYLLWILQYLPYSSFGTWMTSPAWEPVILAYRQFWHTPLLLFLFSIFLIGISLWSANRPVFRLPQGIG